MKRAVLFALVTLLALGATAAPATSPTRPAADDKATKDDYAIDTTATVAKLKVKGEGGFSLKITPKNGKKVHADAPLEITIVDNAAIKPAKQKLGRSDLKAKGAKEPEAVTVLRGVKAGPTTLEVNVSFFLCTDAWCQRMSDHVQIPITVEE